MKFLTAILVGIAIHAGMAVLERMVGLGPGVDPFLRVVPGLAAAVLVTTSRRPPTLFGATSLGAVAGGLVGLLGMIVASLIWLPGGHALPAIASVTGTSVVLGIIGGAVVYSRVRKTVRAERPAVPPENPLPAVTHQPS